MRPDELVAMFSSHENAYNRKNTGATMKQFLVFTAFILLPFFVSAEPGTLSVQGHSALEIEADLLEISFTVANTEKPNIEEAKADVERRASRIIKALTKLGIKEEAIVSPRFEVDTERRFSNRDCPDSWVPVVRRYIEITLNDTENYGKVLDALVKNGVSRINSIQPELSERESHEQKALALAIDDAKKQAAFLAESFGASVAKVRRIGERQVRDNFAMRDEVMAMRRDAPTAKQDDIPYDFKPGKVSIEANIFVEFELKQ